MQMRFYVKKDDRLNERSILMVLIATMLCIPMFGMLPMIAPTTAQNSNIQITKVGRVDGNFLEMDFANYGKSDVWIQVDGILYRNAPATLPTTLDIITHIMGFYFVNDVYHYEVHQWAPVPAGQTTQLFTQGDLQNVDNWLVYNVRVYEDGQFRLLYPERENCLHRNKLS